MPALSCTTAIENARRCLLVCDSETDIESLDVRDWALANGLDISNPTVLASLLQSSACLTCFSDKRLMAATNAVENNRFDTTGASHTAAFAQVKAVRQLASKRRKALLLYLKCNYWNSH